MSYTRLFKVLGSLFSLHPQPSAKKDCKGRRKSIKQKALKQKVAKLLL
jgi:hypothetical protein